MAQKRFFNLPVLAHSPIFARLMWGLAILLVFAAFILPKVDTSLQHESPRAQATPDPFDEEVVALEEAFDAGELADVDPDHALSLATQLKARALTDAGPVTYSEMIWAAEHFDDFQPQIADQPDRASRETLRRHRNALLMETLPRLDEERTDQALNEIRRAYIEAFDVDPAQFSSLPDN